MNDNSSSNIQDENMNGNNNNNSNNLVSSARKEWCTYGSSQTQELEERRIPSSTLSPRGLYTLVVRIINTETRYDPSGYKYVVYIISVTIPGNVTTPKIIEHRFSDFDKLNTVLSKVKVKIRSGPNNNVDIFPSKLSLSGRIGNWTPSLLVNPQSHDELIEYRKIQLDYWLVEVCKQYNDGLLPAVAQQAVYDFLSKESPLPCDREADDGGAVAKSLTYGADGGTVSAANGSSGDVLDDISTVTDDDTCSASSPYQTKRGGQSSNNSSSSSSNGSGGLLNSIKLSNPLSFTLGSAIRQATYIVKQMCFYEEQTLLSGVKPSDQSIPLDLLRHAKGLCFLTVAKVGMVVSGRIGSGLIIARKDNNSNGNNSNNNNNNNGCCDTCQWSAPSAIGTIGMGWGAQVGADVTHYMIVLTTEKGVRDFFNSSTSLKLGTELDVAVGPIGRGGTTEIQTGDFALHQAYSYSHSQGLFVGVSLEGSAITTRSDVNTKFYGKSVNPTNDLLGGNIDPPKAAQSLYDILDLALQQDIPRDSLKHPAFSSPSR